MNKLTKENIEKMALEIADYCHANEYGDVIMYFNNKRVFINFGSRPDMDTEYDIDPHDYFEYAAYNHIFSITSEGDLDLEMELLYQKRLYYIFEKYGVYGELGNSWNCSCYPINDDMEIEYTIYEEPKQTEYISTSNYPKDARFIGLVATYNTAIKEVNPCVCGSIVIGDGINFELDGQPYKFSTNYNQSDVVNHVTEACKRYLISVNATNIWYDCGRLD